MAASVLVNACIYRKLAVYACYEISGCKLWEKINVAYVFITLGKDKDKLFVCINTESRSILHYNNV